MLDSGHQSDHTQHFKGSEVTSQGQKPDLPLGMVNFLPHSEVTLSHPFFPSPSHFCPFFLPFSKSFKVQNNLCPKHPLLSCCQIRLQSVVTGLQEMRTGSVTHVFILSLMNSMEAAGQISWCQVPGECYLQLPLTWEITTKFTLGAKD